MPSIIILNAIAASADLQPLLQAAPWEGQIVAVFQHSLLCSLPQGHLLHLHTGPRLVSPFSLRLEDGFADLLRSTCFVRGMPVNATGSAINIASRIELRLHAMAYYQSPGLAMEVLEPDAVEIAGQILRAVKRPGGFESLPESQALLSRMQQALASGSAIQTLETARRLIGLGPGLTPSGDDVLVGCLRGLWLIGRNPPWIAQTLDCLRDGLLADLDARTTRVSAEFLHYALQGAFAEVLDQAALALLAPLRLLSVRSSIDQMLAQGETSGTDTTLGLLSCIETLWPISTCAARPEQHRTPASLSASSAARR
jgi:hypothetical protein